VIFGGENKLKKALFELIEEGLALVFENRKDSLIKRRQKKCGEACSASGGGGN
jgi:hypothetical protein